MRDLDAMSLVELAPRFGPQAIPMMFQFFRRDIGNHSIAALYGTIVAQARAAPFYRNYRVPDTVNGRFEMVVLHMVLVLRRLDRNESGPEGEARRLGQALFDWFCRDMDGSLREMGVGDLSVPGKMRKIGEAFYGRQAAYAAALVGPEPAELAAALERNIFAGAEGADANSLAAYARAAVSALAAQDLQAICRGELAFPDPATMAARG
jgi:cytochrome b pre-mRNA-processing protein 3